MTVVPFCAWGDGPDVGFNLERTEEAAKGWRNPHLFFAVDLSAQEARQLAADLIRCAEQAEHMDASVAAYFAEHQHPKAT